MNADVFALAAVGLLAATQFQARAEQSETNRAVLSSPKPCLVSLSVADLDKSVKWYEQTLGFAVTKRLDLPKYSVRIAFLDLNGFQIEMIEPKKSISLAEIQKQFPAVDDRAEIQGFGKLGSGSKRSMTAPLR